MAQSKLSAACEDKVLECSICLSDLIKPKQLPCLHNFCLKCLKGHCGSESKKACPMCRQEFSIPQGGVDMLKDNEFIQRLVLEKELCEGKKEPKCELCQEIEIDINAEAFCIECSQCLCKQCQQRHSKQTVSRLHKVVDIKEMFSDAELQKMRPQYCSEHSGKEIELYCCDCEKLLCSLCHATEHNKHACKVTKDIAKLRKESLMKKQNSLQEQSGTGASKLKDLSALKDKLQNEVAQAKSSVEESFTKLIQQIMTYKSDLLESIEEAKQIQMKEIDGSIDMNERHSVELSGFISYCKMLMARGTDCETIRVADELQNRADGLINKNTEQNKAALPEIWVKYVSPPLLTPETLQKHFGSVKFAGLKKDSKSRDIPRQLVAPGAKREVKIIEIEPRRWISGVTVVEDQIFIIQGEKFPQLNVYDSHTLQPLRYIRIPHFESPGEIVSCPYKNVLYITDVGLRCIHRVSLTAYIVKSWNLKKEYWPSGVSVTTDHNVLVTIQIEEKSLAVEYTSEGQLIREIGLDSIIQYAWQTVRLSPDRFISCYGLESSLHGLSIVNSKGQMVKNYDIKRGQSDGLLHVLGAMIVDRSREVVFVNDSGNKRVLMFSTDLSFLGQVRMGLDLYCPSGLWFDSCTGCLLVGDNHPSTGTAILEEVDIKSALRPSRLVIIKTLDQ